MGNAIVNIFAWYILGFSITLPVYFVFKEIIKSAK